PALRHAERREQIPRRGGVADPAERRDDRNVAVCALFSDDRPRRRLWRAAGGSPSAPIRPLGGGQNRAQTAPESAALERRDARVHLCARRRHDWSRQRRDWTLHRYVDCELSAL